MENKEDRKREKRGFKQAGGGAEVMEKRSFLGTHAEFRKTPFKTRGRWQGVGERGREREESPQINCKQCKRCKGWHQK